MGSEDGVVMMKRAEIDTRAPFRSVKEAVTLFGERVLAGELCANKLKEMHGEASENGDGTNSKLGTITAELEETKQNLQKAKEERIVMANYLSSLRDELERRKHELKQLKRQESEKRAMESEIEDVKIVEDSTKFEAKISNSSSGEEGLTEFQKKRYVTFANPPSLAQVMLPQLGQGVEKLERHLSLRKKKKKPLIPLIGGIFGRKKGSQEVAPSSQVL